MTPYQQRMLKLRGKPLTKREKQVWSNIVKGFTDREIGKKLGITHHTVGSFRKIIYRKLGVRNVAGVIRKWYEKK